MKTNLVKGLFLLAIVAGIVFSVMIFTWNSVDSAIPYGANVTEITESSAQPDAASNNSALAGNVTELILFTYTTTQAWHGYYGNVSGTIQLADSSDNVLYNWSLASPEGEVYATINGSVVWQNIQCFNFTANGTYCAADLNNGGGTSECGMNESLLESAYGINHSSDDVDGVDESFSLDGSHELGGGFVHDEFMTNSKNFSSGECLSAHLFSSGTITDNLFQEVLLYSPDSENIVFTAILDEDQQGFDGNYHDFQMIVLEDGHGTDSSPTVYYFYVEIE